jgi:hypothetical protein
MAGYGLSKAEFDYQPVVHGTDPEVKKEIPALNREPADAAKRINPVRTTVSYIPQFDKWAEDRARNAASGIAASGNAASGIAASGIAASGIAAVDVAIMDRRAQPPVSASSTEQSFLTEHIRLIESCYVQCYTGVTRLLSPSADARGESEEETSPGHDPPPSRVAAAAAVATAT